MCILVERAHHASKDKRLGTALSKFELLAAALPSIRHFERLRFEGDLETSERNELLLCILAEYIRERPKSTGGLIKGDSVAGQVSGVRVIIEDHLGRVIIAPSGGKVLAKTIRQMRFEDGPNADRKYQAPLRAAHLERLADSCCSFDVDSPGWPMARWALLLAMHQCLMRGGEPGTLPKDPFRPALGICWSHLVWLNETTLQFDTVQDRRSGKLHWLLTILVRSIKDTKLRASSSASRLRWYSGQLMAATARWLPARRAGTDLIHVHQRCAPTDSRLLPTTRPPQASRCARGERRLTFVRLRSWQVERCCDARQRLRHLCADRLRPVLSRAST